jgi:hypothetical protein
MLPVSYRQRSGRKGEQLKNKQPKEIKVDGRTPDPVSDLEQKDFGKHGYKVFTSTRLEIVLK